MIFPWIAERIGYIFLGLRRSRRYARPRTRRHGESPVGDLLPSASRPALTSSAGARPPPAPFGFRHAAGHEKRPSPYTKTPASRASRKEITTLPDTPPPHTLTTRASRKERIMLDVQGTIAIQCCRRTARRAVPASRRQDGALPDQNGFVSFRAPRRRRFVSRRGEEAHGRRGRADTGETPP